jgi:hypothetical protein
MENVLFKPVDPQELKNMICDYDLPGPDLPNYIDNDHEISDTVELGEELVRN